MKEYRRSAYTDASRLRSDLIGTPRVAATVTRILVVRAADVAEQMPFRRPFLSREDNMDARSHNKRSFERKNSFLNLCLELHMR
jgi:hypothetical protein